MIFRQITHDDLGCASYLVGDDDAARRAIGLAGSVGRPTSRATSPAG